MKLKLTRHFQDMMQHRGINLDHVKKALSDPDETGKSHGNVMKASKKIGSKTIEVVYCKEGFRDKPNEYLLITAYYL